MRAGYFKTVLLLVALFLFLTGAVAKAREVRCTILQQKLGRFYFSAGKEEDVWPGCRWLVYRDSTDITTPLAEGKIAESYEGVSISDSMTALPASLPFSAVAKIEAADSAQGDIRITTKIDAVEQSVVADTIVGGITESIKWNAEERGSQYFRPGAMYTRKGPRDNMGRLTNTVSVSPVSFLIKDWRSTEGNPADVHLSYDQLDCSVAEIRSSSVAPFFVALIPNVSRPVNRNAILTTALRYKIDTSRISSAFEYESTPQMSFLPGPHTYTAYAFDIDKAKKLLKENKSMGSAVSIDTYSPTLQSTSRFISGTLTQAGYRTTTVGWNEPADLRLMILPIYSDSPWVALREVLTSLSADTIERDKSNQPIRLADRLLTDAMQSSDSTQRLRLLQRVDRILQEDVGAFPLFRPIIHVCAKEEIRGIRFDKDGRLDLRTIYRLKLPSDSQESAP